MARSCLDYCKLLLFYLVFYTCLAAFFLLMLFIFSLTVDEKQPKYIVEQSIIGRNPGVSHRPRTSFVESSLIHFRHGDEQGTFHELVESLHEFLQPYMEEPSNSNSNYDYYQEDLFKKPVECVHKGPGEQEICIMNQTELFQGGCTPTNNYGYGEGKPCILIKLNKIFGWIPDPFTDLWEMQDDIPLSIRDAFEKNIHEGRAFLNNRVWLECEGANPADKENLGSITYFPHNGFSAHFYPYLNQDQYRAPIVFVQLNNPKRGVMISIECKAWARNIWHDSRDRLGLAQFEVMID